MPPGKLIYWDSCIFLAWIKNERRDPGIMEGIEETVRAIDEHKAVLVTSVIALVEVIDADGIPGDARTQFTRLFDRPNVSTVSLDIRTSRLAMEIRRHYRDKGINLSVPDVVHLASAINLNVDEFHTLDGSGKKKRRSDLIPLNGDVMGHKLQICVPYQAQLSLTTRHSDAEEEKPDEVKEKDGRK